jgi:hypothetical protein
MEYKKVAPNGDLIVKQVREVPRPDAVTTQTVTPFLINEPAEFGQVVSADRPGVLDVFPYHRLKSRWWTETRSMWLTTQSLQQSLYLETRFEYLDGTTTRALTGVPSSWPGAHHSMHFDGGLIWDIGDSFWTVDGWRIDDLSNPRRYELHTGPIPARVSAADCPIFTLRDLVPDPGMSVVLGTNGELPASPLRLYVEHTHPVEVRPGGDLTTSEDVRLWRLPWSPADFACCSSFVSPEFSITISAKPDAPAGIETIIEGLTWEPIILRGYYSQTLLLERQDAASHMMCFYYWSFLFEPQLEPGISSNILTELRAKNTRLIQYRCTSDNFGSCHGAEIDTHPLVDPSLSARPTWMLYK